MLHSSTDGKYLTLELSGAANVEGDLLQFHVGSKSAGDAIQSKIEASKKAASRGSAPTPTPAPAPAPAPSPAVTAGPKSKSSAPLEQEMVVVLYDFEAQGDDELSVSEHDQLALIEKENDEWWKLQNAAGVVGVVPAAYVEILDSVRDMPQEPAAPRSQTSIVSSTSKGSSRRGSTPKKVGFEGGAAPAAKKPTRTRTWIDATGKFKVDAELVDVRNEHVRLHKTNGSMIEVPFAKMSDVDLAYLEKVTGRRLVMAPSDVVSRPRAEPRQERSRAPRDPRSVAPPRDPRAVAPPRDQRNRRSSQVPSRNIDWFEFFLEAGVDVDNCTRYATLFERDQIDEAILEEVDANMLRSIGLREGDIIRVRRLIDKRNGRTPTNRTPARTASPPRSREDEQRRIREDEELARKLQAQEIAAQRRASGAATRAERVPTERKADKPSPVPERSPAPERSPLPDRTPESKNGVDAETIAAAVELLRERERKEKEADEKDKPKDKPKEDEKKPLDPESALFDKLAGMKPAPKPTMTAAGAKAPFAPVPANQGLLQPLIPLQGTGQIVPTGTGWPASMQGQMTGYPMMPMSTGYPQSPFAGGQMPQMPQMTGMQVPQPQAPQPQQPALGAATAETTQSNDKYSAANVFQQMKTGAFSRDNDSMPQSSGKYDALRAQPTGFASGGIVSDAPQQPQMDASPFAGGFMPQQMTGMPMAPTGMYGHPTGGYMMPPQGYYGQ